MRRQYCGELRKKHIGSNVKLFGWVDRCRDHGGVIFIDLRDKTGTIQVTVDPDQGNSLFNIFNTFSASSKCITPTVLASLI